MKGWDYPLSREEATKRVLLQCSRLRRCASERAAQVQQARKATLELAFEHDAACRKIADLKAECNEAREEAARSRREIDRLTKLLNGKDEAGVAPGGGGGDAAAGQGPPAAVADRKDAAMTGGLQEEAPPKTTSGDANRRTVMRRLRRRECRKRYAMGLGAKDPNQETANEEDKANDEDQVDQNVDPFEHIAALPRRSNSWGGASAGRRAGFGGGLGFATLNLAGIGGGVGGPASFRRSLTPRGTPATPRRESIGAVPLAGACFGGGIGGTVDGNLKSGCGGCDPSLVNALAPALKSLALSEAPRLPTTAEALMEEDAMESESRFAPRSTTAWTPSTLGTTPISQANDEMSKEIAPPSTSAQRSPRLMSSPVRSSPQVPRLSPFSFGEADQDNISESDMPLMSRSAMRSPRVLGTRSMPQVPRLPPFAESVPEDPRLESQSHMPPWSPWTAPPSPLLGSVVQTPRSPGDVPMPYDREIQLMSPILTPRSPTDAALAAHKFMHWVPPALQQQAFLTMPAPPPFLTVPPAPAPPPQHVAEVPKAAPLGLGGLGGLGGFEGLGGLGGFGALGGKTPKTTAPPFVPSVKRAYGSSAWRMAPKVAPVPKGVGPPR
eukprot:TRINITY_DN19921_c0_g1_i1.p1 TRINITY_DN19921_c0_g1~~TRINITY_DN19921_c0_g1_i1.p1  ORF type:complete len:610 (-),score=116.37 TRINITY_DN19921_c0_g1_i1:231-2060(-)